jgi:hypothetical protein
MQSIAARNAHLTIRLGTEADQRSIFAMRHAVYATELGQHAENEQRALSDPLDEFNVYIVATRGDMIAGFVSITPPDNGRYSIDIELMTATVAGIREHANRLPKLLNRLQAGSDWQLDVPFWPAEACYHGGQFFQAIGTEFDSLDRRRQIVNADVLDAWYPPAPAVLDALRSQLVRNTMELSQRASHVEALSILSAKYVDEPPVCLGSRRCHCRVAGRYRRRCRATAGHLPRG